MSLTLSDYTDNKTVRGLLGVAPEEVTDADFTALESTNLLEVTLALEEISEGLPAQFEAVKAITAASRSAVQTRFFSLVQVYAAYTVASKIANGALAMFAPVTIQSNAANVQTRQQDPYAQLRSALTASLGTWQQRLVALLPKLDASLSAASVPRLFAGSAGLNLDPVTGA